MSMLVLEAVVVGVAVMFEGALDAVVALAVVVDADVLLAADVDAPTKLEPLVVEFRGAKELDTKEASESSSSSKSTSTS